MSKDFSDLIFRFLFSLIFLGLGGEHIVSDDLIQRMMPDWIPIPRIVSIASGIILVSGGLMIALGYRIRKAAIFLGAFVVVVTIVIHAPALMTHKSPIASDEDRWIWDTLQRSNFVKNLCLLGVCVMLTQYKLGKYSLEAVLKKSKSR